ncbi:MULTISPECIES: iron-containing alcohol dehydrogenase [unclassified Breznakia]|uniref:iron-containing alcohol dehydrogenase n=1 Tax=unclassified Breznakia TaxID=2623764 RepID=UPI002475DB25|nr:MULTISPECIES: iron-containing alcohol dehydrogenase [unclassified Breznakia]MDH6367767.1 alcohol dehydrogenase YqhD (iron-dependent ADH family) [Breznakia sp. PH1-1]MDH6404879.1 alcohol dehydrogenase YqhD (iron-dependent ADH family) [Breznakia sp. PF1-11]MDH6412594.1 alcohol dehydrogenase YqhD (iron-dependent ADH family) [Breznakia sp. PFB1-11]MDH6414930.1 alcohol dehydrogenase YqhD (iron-dependent ADH family) [Breznakia sp. PFB1-14]MDH6417241.1 alcohol dehydrogenase YqhD (iron-dependent AD
MENFSFYAPTYFAFGKESESEVGKLVKRFGGTKVLIHYGGGSVVRSGLLDRVKKSLDEQEITYMELGGVKPNPRSGLVYEGIDICKDNAIDFVLAVGGGSVIDSAKAIAAGAIYDGDFWDYYTGKRVDQALPIGTVLTIAAAGSEGSPDSVITNEDGMYKRGSSGEGLRPKFSVLNPELTQTLPAYQSAAGITDIMAHLMERYMTNTTDVEVTDRMIEGLLKTMIHEGPKVIENPNNYQARANIMWAGMMAHNNSCGVGCTQDWASHDIEHELSATYDVTHGAGLAVVMPQVMRYNMNHDLMRFVQLAHRVWNVEIDFTDLETTANKGIDAFQQFLALIGMPTTFAQIGAKEKDIPAMAHSACYGNKRSGSIGDFVSLNEADVINIYKMCL